MPQTPLSKRQNEYENTIGEDIMLMTLMVVVVLMMIGAV
jgi:hypothetical protein